MAESDANTLSKGEQTRGCLVDAALELFLEQGYHGTSMRQIADRAGLALGGIYNHFDSKEEIFAAVLDVHHPLTRVLPQLGQAQGETAEEFVRDAAHRILNELQGEGGRVVSLALTELVEFQGRHLVGIVEQALPSLLLFVQRFSDRRGRIRNLPVPLLLRMFIVTIVGYVLTDLILKRVPVFKAMDVSWFDGMLDIYLHGILEAQGN
jgi:AcrR family transcriptional regulator